MRTILAIKTIFVIIMALLLVEIALRTPGIIYSRQELAEQKYFMLMIKRLHLLWSQKDDVDPFVPPYDVYANRDFQNPERLKDIHAATRARRDFQSESYDFLRDLKYKAQTKYKVCLNNLGFRSCKQYSINKAPNTRRIIVYGSYQAFGFGLNEENAYSTQLEKLLNASSQKIKYEVWNSGRQAASGIVGLANLKQDIIDYRPDLVIYDYGFTDGMIVSDNDLPFVNFFQRHPTPLKLVLNVLSGLAAESHLVYRIWVQFSYRAYPKNLAQFVQVTEEFLRVAQTANLPVIMVRQMMNQTQPTIYKKVLEKFPSVDFIDGSKVFDARAEEETPPAQDDSFWLNDFSAEEKSLLRNSYIFKHPYMRLDLWQLNPTGQQIMAKAIYDGVRKAFMDSSARK
jgi:hypothetical protein